MKSNKISFVSFYRYMHSKYKLKMNGKRKVDFEKSDLLCLICNKILSGPRQLPCLCTICDIHLKDGSVKNGLITCVSCGEEFAVKNIQCKVNKLAKYLLDKEEHLSSKEKEVKSSIEELFDELQHIYDCFKQKQTTFELNSHAHFAEIKNQIDIHREKFKSKIDEIALEMIKRIEDNETVFKRKLNEFQRANDLKIDDERAILEAEFRNMTVDIERVEQLKAGHNSNITKLQSKMCELKFMTMRMSSCLFELNKEFAQTSFGY